MSELTLDDVITLLNTLRERMHNLEAERDRLKADYRAAEDELNYQYHLVGELKKKVAALETRLREKDTQIGRLIGILPQEARDRYVSQCIETATALMQEKLDALETRLRAAQEAIKAALEVQDEDCWYDHHGLCQAHHLRTNEKGEPECEVGLLRKALAGGDSQ